MRRLAAAALVVAACTSQSSAPTGRQTTATPQTDASPAQPDAGTPHSAYFRNIAASRDRMCACRSKACVEKLGTEVDTADAASSLPDEQDQLMELGKQLMDCARRSGGAR
jgi:hypothetical protein